MLFIDAPCKNEVDHGEHGFQERQGNRQLKDVMPHMSVFNSGDPEQWKPLHW